MKTKQTTGHLRIIGGQWRSRKLMFPDVEGLRPTPDRVRETLFNWLQTVVPGAHCLDLFAGSGALGLEALSRGATRAVFVDQDAVAIHCLREHVQTLRATNAQVMQADVLAYLQGGRFLPPATLVLPCTSVTPGILPPATLVLPCTSQDTQEPPSLQSAPQCFDVVFIDPPYRHYDLLQDCCKRLETGGWLAPQAYIYLETESSRNVPPLPPNWQMIRSKKAGHVGYHLMLREAVSSLVIS